MPITDPDPYELDGVTVGSTELSVISGTTTLQTATADGLYQFWLDPVAAAMVKGDMFKWRAYEKVIGSGTKRVVMSGTLSHAQSQAIVIPRLIMLHGYDFTLQKLAGGDRAWDAGISEITGSGISEPHTLSAVTIGNTAISIPSGTATLSTRTEKGMYQLFIDPIATALAAADAFLLEVWEKVEATGGTKRVIYEAPLVGTQLENFVSPVLELKRGWDATLRRTAGADRAMDASIRKVA